MLIARYQLLHEHCRVIQAPQSRGVDIKILGENFSEEQFVWGFVYSKSGEYAQGLMYCTHPQFSTLPLA